MAESEQLMTVEPNAAATEAQAVAQPRTLKEIIISQLETLRTHHKAVLETDDPEAIHKMRVATRRLQASLDLLGREFHVQKLKRMLRKWRRMLSRVRNYDVFLISIEKEAASHGPSKRSQYELLKAILHKRRQRRAARVRAYMQKIDVGVIAKKLGISITPIANEALPAPDGESIEAAAVTEAASKGPGGENEFVVNEHKVAGHAAARLEQRLAEFHALAAQSLPSTNASDLHELRIAAKRVRYLMEIISELGYGDAARALGWLRTLQDKIGDWHDLEALEEQIIEIVSRRRFMKEHLAESSLMLQAAARLQKKKETLVSKLFPVRVPRNLNLTSQRMTKALRRLPHKKHA